MAEPRERSSSFGASWRRPTLGTKLIFFSTLLVIVSVAAAFFVLSFSLEKHTRRLLSGTLARHQVTLSHLQQDSLTELLRISALMTDSPTLRAAVETITDGSVPDSGVRPDLLATIQTETDTIAARLGGELLVVTDRDGKVLAASGTLAVRPAIGRALAAHPFVQRVLAQEPAPGAESFALLELDGTFVRVGAVPIVLQGFVIGSLTLGTAIDQAFVLRLERSFDCDVTVLVRGRVLGSTLSQPFGEEDLRTLRERGSAVVTAPGVVRLTGEDWVAAGTSLGSDAEGGEAELIMLTSLTRTMADSSRYLLWVLVGCGVWAVLVVGTANWWMSRLLLRPLDDFVGFMRAVATTGDHARRFHSRSWCAEVDTLNDAYNLLMDSLIEHEQRLLRSAREEMSRLERLKESEKLAALGRTLSGAAHEINNPLTGVLGNLELLLRDQTLAARERERLERVRREAQRIATLVRNVLKISHRDTGERKVVDLCQVIRDTIDVRRHDFTSAGMRVDLELGPEPIEVLGNELELQQVFLNVIGNAYDALKDSGPFPALWIRAVADRGRAEISLTDNGPGLRDPGRVFEHFYTTKPVGKGTGLGLAICHAIVQGHGGRITAENLARGGARFTIELPLATGRGAVATPQPGATVAAPPPADGPLEASVLVVDDEPTIVELQKEILEALGASVVGVCSGGAAIEELSRRPFDLVISDVKMPGAVSGKELFRWVEANRPEHTLGFVFVTGDSAGDGSRSFVDSVGARCVMKPFSTDDYVRTVREAWRGTRQGR